MSPSFASFVTPLRYPGGKGRLGQWLAGLLKHNELDGGTYIEPYAGGAGAALYLLVNGHVRQILINDADPVVYAFWWSLVYEMDGLVERIRKTPVTMDTWHQQKELITGDGDADLLDLGFAAFFMNRTNRSGILSGGVIGGQTQNGKYKIDARYNKEDLIKRITNIADLRTKIDVKNLDAMELVQTSDFDKKSLIYLDPPYYKKGSQLYRNYYNPEDHLAISKKVKSLKTPWLVTYDGCDEIRRLYSDVSGVEFSFHYSTHTSRPKSTELMYYSGIKLHTEPKLRR